MFWEKLFLDKVDFWVPPEIAEDDRNVIYGRPIKP